MIMNAVVIEGGYGNTVSRMVGLAAEARVFAWLRGITGPSDLSRRSFFGMNAGRSNGKAAGSYPAIIPPPATNGAINA